MSIASELSALNGYILGAYDEVNTMGGAVPQNKNMANLATAIGTIPTGGGTTITPLSVTSNGTYTAPTGTAYSPVTVSVSGGITFGDWVLSTGTIVPTETISTNYTITLPTTTVSGTIDSSPATAIFFFALELPPYANIANYYTSLIQGVTNYNIKREVPADTGPTFVANFDTSGGISRNIIASALTITGLRASEIEVKFGCTSSRQLLAGCTYRWMAFVKSGETE